jgi:transcriptional regulator with XRE-family HTH domain
VFLWPSYAVVAPRRIAVDIQVNVSIISIVATSKDTLGSRIKELRISAKLSQRELADRVARRLKENERRGLDFTYLSKIENNRLEHPPSVLAIIALAGELEADSDELLALAGKAPPDVGQLLQKSQGARMFFRSALSTRLSEEDWKKLVEQIHAKKK